MGNVGALKRILFCEGNTDGTIGGSHFILFSHVTELDQTRFDPVIVFHQPNRIADQLISLGFQVHSFELPTTLLRNAPRFVRWPAYLIRNLLWPTLRIYRFLSQHRIDLVHLNNTIEHSHIWIAGAFLAGIPCFSHERSHIPNFGSMARFFAPRLKRIICVSNAVENNLHNQGIGRLLTEVIHDGIDPAMVKTVRSPAAIRAELSLPPDCPVVGIVGNIKHWKGQAVVVEAMSILHASIPNLKCLLIGATASVDRDYEQSLRQRIADFGLQDSVFITGYKQDPYDYMNSLDIVIHASIEPEPFGMVVVEAMSLCKPVVASNAGGPRETVLDGETGMLFTPGNAQELAAVLSQLLADPTRRQAMGKAGLARVKEVFHIDLNRNKTIALYDRFLND